MNNYLRINKAGVELIKQDRDWYQKNREQNGNQPISTYLSLNNLIFIGYRSTNPQFKYGKRITESEAEHFFRKDIEYFEKVVKQLVKVELNENEFSALVSFAYKWGENVLKKSTALRRLNKGDRFGCAEALRRWNKGSYGAVKKLVKRYRSEGDLFLSQAISRKAKYKLEHPPINQNQYSTSPTMTINYQKMVIICRDKNCKKVLTLSPTL
ncbi:MAG: lysozyme [Symploca sp. SIO1B1]|nr:lysozyme [Symploca sp. SIO1A3]NER95400.1 lysozyme [Symploca sp. SIO1B1]